MSGQQTMEHGGNPKLSAARQLVDEAVVHYQGHPIGTLAALDHRAAAGNYGDCFVRDFVPAGLLFLAEGRYDIVRNFLSTVVALRTQRRSAAGHELQPGVMPASFRVTRAEDGSESLEADFGEQAIGRVAPVDSMMWWMILLHAYATTTGDEEFAERRDVQVAMEQILGLGLRDMFEVTPALLVPDGCCMVDRRLGIYGHPIEIQALFFGGLRCMRGLLLPRPQNVDVIKKGIRRQQALVNYVRYFYWLDLEQLNTIHRYRTEEFGSGTANMLNIYPESIPDWVVDWLPPEAGYLVGNLGPGRMDFRFFALGNLLAVIVGLTTDEQSQRIMDLYEQRWSDLIGAMPVKICYPALEGVYWQMLTGSDPKNVPWSYHNAGNWPALLWVLVAAALKTGRRALAERAVEIALAGLNQDQFPEYYDGRHGRLVGRRANLNQTWTAASLVLAQRLLDAPQLLRMLPGPGPHSVP